MLDLVNKTYDSIGNIEQSLGFEKGTLYRRAKSWTCANVVQSFKSASSNGQQFAGHNYAPGQYGNLKHYGAHEHCSLRNGRCTVVGDPSGHIGLSMQCAHPTQFTLHGSPGYEGFSKPYLQSRHQCYSTEGQPRKLRRLLSLGVSTLKSYVNGPGSSGMNDASDPREIMEHGRLFVPGVLFHVRRFPLEENLIKKAKPADVALVKNADEGSFLTTSESSTSQMKHIVIKSRGPQERFKKIVLSKTLLSDHSLASYKDAITDASRSNRNAGF
ncbi:hypothetical protein KP509_38G045800 [Ceratopteris richardii]|uniref:Uncharacterized protein n=1 Tax=Ceratopteris richardii TaxID=49495 RepID=A0A8T2Q4E2_CERRI|nr:hypothetical protein KP509_38G045800 [Ceratopteris richardii]KAH7278545.1 hypothetical protein KP509_38G045800 [Ceratopteris richardii]